MNDLGGQGFPRPPIPKSEFLLVIIIIRKTTIPHKTFLFRVRELEVIYA